ncbi:hypothetical protein E2C01_042547 [Portunus trituberculatus]|uniref:Uncharacterized protein n=1 Tax=Portunus trituberculatus TaxID=210409 RepID=A0A5B7FTX2_PORTR|nr:hypothetical protein [Portunus trituberculatus]
MGLCQLATRGEARRGGMGRTWLFQTKPHHHHAARKLQ